MWIFICILKSISHQIEIENKCEVKEILNRQEYLKKVELKEIEAINDKEEWPAYVQLTNGKLYGCDFIISATGVTPNIQAFTKNNKVKIPQRNILSLLLFVYLV